MCQGKTKAGKPCKRVTEPYCQDHDPTRNDPVVLPCPLNGLNTKAVEKKIITKVKRGPRQTDGYGHIYVYYLDSDPKDSYYKIGMTERDVDVRLKEWKGSKLKKSFRVANRKYAERLIHLYLDYRRVYRYKQEDGSLASFWKDTGKPVTDSDSKGKQEGRTKQIEWFFVPFQDVERICKAICK